jgi:hypothetical protein
LGNHFITPEPTGIAIVDVNSPLIPIVTDYWIYQGPNGGGGMVQVENDYAYLGGMTNGLFVFDVSDKHDIDSLSQFLPDIGFPDPNPDTPKYNLRGLVVKDDIVYSAFDAGGVRIINCTDKGNPIETGRYSNPIMNGKPRAYNNLVLYDSFLYVAVDYCGLEVLNISDTSTITQASWWNPWTCESNPFKWLTSPGHSNEIVMDTTCQVLFLSTGRSDMYVVDISDPTTPDSCGHYGNTTDSLATWGVARHDGQLFLSYICVPWPYIPFPGIWTGVKMFSYQPCPTGVETPDEAQIELHPNPASRWVFVGLPGGAAARLIDMMGREMEVAVDWSASGFTLDLNGLPDGAYLLSIDIEETVVSRLLVKSSP